MPSLSPPPHTHTPSKIPSSLVHMQQLTTDNLNMLNQAQLRTSTPLLTKGPMRSLSECSNRGTTCTSQRFSSTPADTIGNVPGFSTKITLPTPSGSLAVVKGGPPSIASSNRLIAVGHGSVRPPLSVGSRVSSTGDVMLESLEAQLEEERQYRKAMESKIERITTLLEKIVSKDESSTSGGGSRRAASAERSVAKNNPRGSLNRVGLNVSNSSVARGAKPPLASRPPPK